MKDVEDIYELSPLQQGMLFDAIALGDSGMYRVYLAYDLRGSLDLDAFRRAWKVVTDRQPVLRTSIHWEGMEKPIQVVHSDTTLPIEEADWRGLSQEEVDRRTREYLRQERDRPFDLTEAPLLRLALFRTADDCVRLVWWMHHLLIEGWSASIVLDEVFTCYRALSHGEPIQLPPVPLYRDFLLWLQARDPAAAESYWRTQLRGFDTPTGIPFDKGTAGGAQGVVAFERRHFQMPETETKELDAFVRRHQLTQGSVVQSAWALLLSRYSGQPDVMFGALVSGRSAPLSGIESMVGMTVNTVPVRVGVPGDAVVLPWLRERLSRQVEMIPFEHCGLRQLREWSDLPRSSAPFETLIAFRNWSGDLSLSASDDSLEVREFESQQIGQGYPITIEITPGPRLTMSALYDGQRFDGEDIERVIRHLGTLLSQLVRSPESRLEQVPMLGPAEREQLVTEWNSTESDYPDTPMPELFREQADRRPESVAVSCGDHSLDYRQLDMRANQLARYLTRLGVVKGARVGICVERGVDMVVGLLGILRAGAAYVPLDPAYPSERIAFMLEDSGASVLVTQDSLLAALPVHAARTVSLDGDRVAIAAESTEGLPPRSRAEDIAYVIYTSGSTGRPKGVQVPHRALSNFLHAMAARPGLGADDVLVAVTTLCFDIAMLELLLPLVVGGRVVVASREDALDPVRLAQLLESSGATALQATPATWRMLVASGWGGRPQLEILCGGEALPRDLADALLSRGRRVWNLYGPTETTIWSTVCQVRPGEGPVSIGRPIANTRVYVLDEALLPAPIGVPGELYIGGDGVSAGYLERPDLTRERFVPDPFVAAPEARLYRTGDRARFRADGDLEYLGRLDQQVKLRGFRIELGEVEATLRAHPRVREAAAVVREDVPGDARLTAYVVPADDEPLSVHELREFVRVSLPEYMVPSAIVYLEALPQTANGKLDRRALPAPERGTSEQIYVAPRSAAEALLAALWCEVLELDQVSVYDHFFDLGGHSMLTLTVIAKFEEKTGFRLDPVGFFQQTLAQVAASYEPLDASVESATADGIGGCRLEPFFMASGGRQLFALERVATRPRGRGVLLCHPHAHEYDRCHRAHRELALQLARRGYDSLSFDYSGCGDSAGSYGEARLSDWSADVSAAMDVLKRRGLERIAVVGTRLGATLAMLAAVERDDVDALVLWQPVVHGPLLVEEYQKLAAAGAQARGPEQVPGDLVDVAGYPLVPALTGDLAAVDLTAVRGRSAPHVLVLENALEGEPELLREFAAGLPSGAEYRRVGDAGVWQRDLYESVVPVATLHEIVRWLEEVHP